MSGRKIYKPLPNNGDVLSILNKISIFGGLSGEQLHFIFGLLQKVSYKAGEYIFRQGDEPSYIYLVRSGAVKIIAEEGNGGPFELAVFESGQCFGETSVIGIQPHSASAIAVRDTELIVLSGDTLLSIFKADKELFGILILNIAREACRRLHHTDEVMLHYVLRKT